MEFQEFPKMPRLSREIVVTEKIDGTNAQVNIVRSATPEPEAVAHCLITGTIEPAYLSLLVGSRTRYITPDDDNFGFARWVQEHASELFQLGPGTHFGEWWGSKIQRGYGLVKGDKRFSLFNVTRWCPHGQEPQRIPQGDPRVEKFQDVLPACCGLVPVLYTGLFNTFAIDAVIDCLRHEGSKAAPGYMNPEGVVIYHTQGNLCFKKTIEKDEGYKSGGQ